MRFLPWFLAALFAALAMATSAEARVNIQVDLASQTMHVSSATGDYDWPISSARRGYRTPHGSFGVKSLQTMHRSRKYHNSPMPHSIFFSGGYAIHGTYATRVLGTPASHGCIRISPANAAALFQMVRAEGARIQIIGNAPAGETRYARNAKGKVYAARLRQRGYAAAPYGYGGSYGAGDRSVDPSWALGYAPVAPSVYQWMADPSGY